MIVLLTGVIRTGKTTALRDAFGGNGQARARGIVQPVIDGQRHLEDLASGAVRRLEASASTPQDSRMAVGRFVFDASALAWGTGCIQRAVVEVQSDEWVVLDEVGPLELAGHGLATAVHAVVRHADTGGRALIVVREGLIEAVAGAFQINQPHLIRLGDRLPDGGVLDAPW